MDSPAAQLPVAWRPTLLAACGRELPLRPASEVMAETGGPHRGDTVEEGVGVDDAVELLVELGELVEVPVMEGEGVVVCVAVGDAVDEREPVPLALELGVPVRLDEDVPVALADDVPVIDALGVPELVHDGVKEGVPVVDAVALRILAMLRPR